MWRAPKLHGLEAPTEFKKLIKKSIYFNRKGKLQGASTATIVQYSISLFIAWVSLSGIVIITTGLIFNSPPTAVANVLISLALLTTLLVWFVYWGWYDYQEAWYHFDDHNEIFSVTKRTKGNWETFEIPYDAVHEVEWSGGEFGYATIHASKFSFDTTRTGSERYASVTELWPHLARFDTNMINWPIILKCTECKREFGHHIGTAQCPFDNVILIDPEVKGRIDPEEMHPDDKSRV